MHLHAVAIPILFALLGKDFAMARITNGLPLKRAILNDFNWLPEGNLVSENSQPIGEKVMEAPQSFFHLGANGDLTDDVSETLEIELDHATNRRNAGGRSGGKSKRETSPFPFPEAAAVTQDVSNMADNMADRIKALEVDIDHATNKRQKDGGKSKREAEPFPFPESAAVTQDLSNMAETQDLSDMADRIKELEVQLDHASNKKQIDGGKSKREADPFPFPAKAAAVKGKKSSQSIVEKVFPFPVEANAVKEEKSNDCNSHLTENRRNLLDEIQIESIPMRVIGEQSKDKKVELASKPIPMRVMRKPILSSIAIPMKHNDKKEKHSFIRRKFLLE